MSLSPLKVREFFPTLNQKVNGQSLVYLDSAASTLKASPVINAINRYYTDYSCNIHRGIHSLSEKGTIIYEQGRDELKKFINAAKREEIVFTSGTTASLNLIAHSLSSICLNPGDIILLGSHEHHSNIVPWQFAAEKFDAEIKVIPLDLETTELNMDGYQSQLEKFGDKIKIISVNAISNTLGIINPVKKMISLARKHTSANFIVDAAQAVAHQRIDVQDFDCEFLVGSFHKMFGPTGLGFMYGKEAILNQMPPFLGGGDMIDKVTFEKTTFNDLPYKFEAGTPPIAAAFGVKATIDFINFLNIEKIQAYEAELMSYLLEQIKQISEVTVIGNSVNRSAILPFKVDGLHPQDVATFLDKDGIAIRTGHHCTQPLLQLLGESSLCRASLSIYNTKEEIDHFIQSLKKIIDLFR